jgi:hypothetical protein
MFVRAFRCYRLLRITFRQVIVSAIGNKHTPVHTQAHTHKVGGRERLSCLYSYEINQDKVPRLGLLFLRTYRGFSACRSGFPSDAPAP